MATLEQVERLREKANVSFAEAKEALDATGGDLLEALIYLEKQGKVPPPPGGGTYSSYEKEEKSPGAENSHQPRYESCGEVLRKIGRLFLKIIRKGNSNYFEVVRGGNTVISCPVTVLVILLLFMFWVVVPLLIIGLFFDFRYRFRGNELGKETINRVMDSASNAAEEIKKSVKTK
ncbi:MAG: ubiquitin [Clostridiales bacterium]|nr:ubiquitin [Clostridiales bacterium]